MTQRINIIDRLRRAHRYFNKFPLECDYQNCAEPIVGVPFVSKNGQGHCRTRHYHVKCAEILRVI